MIHIELNMYWSGELLPLGSSSAELPHNGATRGKLRAAASDLQLHRGSSWCWIGMGTWGSPKVWKGYVFEENDIKLAATSSGIICDSAPLCDKLRVFFSPGLQGPKWRVLFSLTPHLFWVHYLVTAEELMERPRFMHANWVKSTKHSKYTEINFAPLAKWEYPEDTSNLEADTQRVEDEEYLSS